MKFFEGKTFHLDKNERHTLALLVREGLASFNPPIDSPKARRKLNRGVNAPFGGDQMIRNYLEIFLIQLMRRGGETDNLQRTAPLLTEEQEDDLLQKMIGHMQDHLSDRVTYKELCGSFSIGRTTMIKLFKSKTNLSPLEYYHHLKMERAKRLIREGEHNFSEIAGMLGYNSVHYFSRQFKQWVNATPTEYARLIKLRTAPQY